MSPLAIMEEVRFSDGERVLYLNWQQLVMAEATVVYSVRVLKVATI